MFAADHHIGRTVIRRGEITEVDDSGDLQLVTARGLDGERFKRAHRVQYFGSSEVPPVGSHGLFLLANGRPDQATLMGFEHPQHRPRNTPTGCKVLYNMFGDAISLIENKIRLVTTTFEIHGNVEITGDITQTGNFNQAGVHVDSNGLHTA